MLMMLVIWAENGKFYNRTPSFARFLGSDGDVVIVINDARREPGPGAEGWHPIMARPITLDY